MLDKAFGFEASKIASAGSDYLSTAKVKKMDDLIDYPSKARQALQQMTSIPEGRLPDVWL